MMPDLQIQQAPYMRAPRRWPLVNTLNSRSDVFTKDARLINAYAEKDPATGEYQVEKRPGFAKTPVIYGSGVGQGIVTYPYVQNVGSNPYLGVNYLTLYVSGGHAFSLVTDAAGGQHGPTNLGPVSYSRGTKFQFLGVPNTAGYPSILFGGDNTIAIGSSACYAYTNGVLTTLGGGGTSGFPSNTVPGYVYLDGFCYVMDYSGAIWETVTQNVISGVGSWSTLDFITAGSDADIGVQLARQLIYIVAIKTWTTQFYYDAGNTVGSSLSPVPGALYNFGCINSDTFADLDGVLFWATQSKEGTYRVVMMDKLRATFISTPAVEKQLDLGPGATWYSTAYQHAGHRWYILTNLTSNTTMVYDIGEKLWMLWTDYLNNYYPVIGRCAAPDGSEWHQMGATGNVYQLEADYICPNDYGNIVQVDIYTPNADLGVDRSKCLSQMRFNADQVKGSQLMIRSSDDDYMTWNSFRTVNFGIERPILSDEGSFYRRAYNFRHYASTPMRIRSVDLQVDIGTL